MQPLYSIHISDATYNQYLVQVDDSENIPSFRDLTKFDYVDTHSLSKRF